MKVNAICIVKNEADIILETLNNALRFCDTIYVFDNGSTDGSWELICKKSLSDYRIVIAAHTDEIYCNQFRNRVYNMYHSLYSASDWWYILDADEMLTEAPRPLLIKAMQRYKNQMRVWQAQFYFTDKDLAAYDQEDKTLEVSERRRYYRINWREPRFFRNSPNENWPENISGKVPPFCQNLYHPSPIYRHYAQRTPKQIKMRRETRLSNPYRFLHVKNKSDDDGLKHSEDCFYYQKGKEMTFPIRDRVIYYASQTRYWLILRAKNVLSLKKVLFSMIFRNVGSAK